MNAHTCPEWLKAEVPNTLSGADFKLYRTRLEHHKRSVKSARPVTDLQGVQKEVGHLESLASTHQRTRKFKVKETDKQIRKENSRLVQQLCEVAKRRPLQAVADDPSVSRTLAFESLRAPLRLKEANNINFENEGLLRRLESARPAVQSITEATADYARHKAIVARNSRFKRPVNAKVPPPLPRPAKPQGQPSAGGGRRKRRGKYNPDGPLYCPNKPSPQVRLEPLENRPLPDSLALWDEIAAGGLAPGLAEAFVDQLTSQAANAMLKEASEEPWEVASIEPRSDTWSRESARSKLEDEQTAESRHTSKEHNQDAMLGWNALHYAVQEGGLRTEEGKGEAEPPRDRLAESGTGPWFKKPETDAADCHTVVEKAVASQADKDLKNEEKEDEESFEDFDEESKEDSAEESKESFHAESEEDDDEEESAKHKALQPQVTGESFVLQKKAEHKPTPAKDKAASAQSKAMAKDDDEDEAYGSDEFADDYEEDEFEAKTDEDGFEESDSDDAKSDEEEE